MKSIFLKIINITLILSAFGLGLWLFNKNFPATGQLEVILKPGVDQPMISRLGPDPRIKLENDYQIILDDPVYFDLRAPRWFHQARIEVVYQELGRTLNGLGLKTGADWQYEVSVPSAEYDLADGWKKAVFYSDLDSAYQQKNVSRFVISTKGEIRAELKIKSIEIILNK